jgi:hypothetical protein
MAVDPGIHRAYVTALQSGHPVLALREAAQSELRALNGDRDRLVHELEQLLLEARAEGREADEEVVADVIDFVVGNCSPHMRIR